MESLFGIGGPELILILVLATIVLGPLNMIKMARQFGILLRDLRNYYNSLTANLSQELGELAELQETIKDEVNAALPKPEELQVAVPDLGAEAQKVLDAPAPNAPTQGAPTPGAPEASPIPASPQAVETPTNPYEAASQSQESGYGS